MLLDIKWSLERIEKGNCYFSKRGDFARQNNNLTIKEIEDALLSGRILEQNKDTGREPTCLILGFTRTNMPIHIVCGKRENWIVIITVYIPSAPKFKTPDKRG